MENYKSGSHSRHDLKAHVVWITKYRKAVLRGHVSRDHVHLFVGYPPGLSVSKLVQRLKGKSSWRMLQEFNELRRKFWGQRLWGRGYFVASSGNVTDEVIMQYIAQQDQEQGSDEFKISDEPEA